MATNVYVFQVSVTTNEQIQLLEKEINLLPSINQWNFDLDDPEFRIFRIVSGKNISKQVIALFTRLNLKCLQLFAGRYLGGGRN